jgi:hypothetical protein
MNGKSDNIWRTSGKNKDNRISILVGTICPTCPMTFRWRKVFSSPRKGIITVNPALAGQILTNKNELNKK